MIFNLSWPFSIAQQFCIPFSYVLLLHVLLTLTLSLNYIFVILRRLSSLLIQRGRGRKEKDKRRRRSRERERDKESIYLYLPLLPFNIANIAHVPIFYRNLPQSVSIFLLVSITLATLLKTSTQPLKTCLNLFYPKNVLLSIVSELYSFQQQFHLIPYFHCKTF